jgi:2-isopropylmalate synthase
MEYKLKMTSDQVLEQAVSAVKYAKKFCSDVEFSAEDASRSDPDFVSKVFSAVIAAGATVLNFPETTGYAMPGEFARLVKTVKSNTTGIEKADFSVHVHNDLGLAVANTLAAIEAGADQVECTINGIGERAGNASLEEIVMALKTRRDYWQCDTRINTAELYPASRLVTKVTGVKVQPNKAIVGENAFAHEAGIHQHGVLAKRETYEIIKAEDVGSTPAVMVLGKHSGRHAFRDRLETLGYQLEDEQVGKAFARFKEICDENKEATDGDIEAIIADEILSVTPSHRYELKSYAAHVGGGLASAAVVVARDGEELRDAATGNGPIDAAFLAIKRAIGFSPELETFAIRATSPSSDAMGETTLVLKYGEVRAQGRGVSTDIIESGIRAYVNAVNRLFSTAAARDIKIN